MNHFSIWLWRTTKSGLYTTADDSQLSGWTEEKLQSISQSQTCTRKWSWSLFGGLLLVCSISTFWIAVKPSHLRRKLSKSTRWTKNCNSCSQHWSSKVKVKSLTHVWGSSVPGILQARTLEWVAISFSGGSSQPKDRTQVCHLEGEFFIRSSQSRSQTRVSCIAAGFFTSWGTREVFVRY